MRIFIPTLGRGPELQYTLRELGPALIKKYNATLVCAPADAKALRAHNPWYGTCEVLPCKVQGNIGKVRQWIVDNTDDPHILVMDDDLQSWSWREEITPLGGHEPGVVSYRKATPQQRASGLAEVAKLLKRYAHGSIGHRLFANNREALEFNTRQLRALAYDVNVLKAEGIKFRMELMEDLDMQLQLIKRGHEGFQINTLVQEQKGSNEAGGCSVYRSDERQTAAANKLAQLHPDCVTVVQKKQKGNGTMWGDRTDVRISWRKAIRAGMEYRHAHH